MAWILKLTSEHTSDLPFSCNCCVLWYATSKLVKLQRGECSTYLPLSISSCSDYLNCPNQNTWLFAVRFTSSHSVQWKLRSLLCVLQRQKAVLATMSIEAVFCLCSHQWPSKHMIVKSRLDVVNDHSIFFLELKLWCDLLPFFPSLASVEFILRTQRKHNTELSSKNKIEQITFLSTGRVSF